MTTHMQNTREFAVAPKLAHHLIGILLTGAVAGGCAHMAVTNTSGILTRRTNLTAETLNIILWILCVAAGLLCLIFLVELILTRTRPVPKIRLTATGLSIPAGTAFKKRTVEAKWEQITQVMILLIAPNRVLRIHTTVGNATVAELNVEAGVFEEIHAALVQHARCVGASGAR